jgi:hypothetical protein
LPSCQPAACGGAGQACCPGGVCAESGCCLDGACRPPGTTCQAGGAAYGVCEARDGVGRCSGCGVGGAPCCPAALRGQPGCAADLACVIMMADMPALSQCVPCGGPGQTCCARNGCAGGCCARTKASDPGTCVAEGVDCPDGAVCVDGACGACGRVGQRCCDATCTAPGSTCRVVAAMGETCIACGGRGQPCCFDQPGAPGCAPQLTCRTDLCLEP